MTINKQKQVKQKTHVSGKMTYLPPTFVVPNAQNIVTVHLMCGEEFIFYGSFMQDLSYKENHKQ